MGVELGSGWLGGGARAAWVLVFAMGLVLAGCSREHRPTGSDGGVDASIQDGAGHEVQPDRPMIDVARPTDAPSLDAWPGDGPASQAGLGAKVVARKRDEGFAVVTDVEVAPDGGVYFAGWFAGTLELADGTLLREVDGPDAFVARIASDGRLAWLRPLMGPAWNLVTRLAVTPDGGVLAALSYGGRFDPGTGELSHSGVWDGALAHYGPGGVPRWTRRVGSPGLDEVMEVEVAGETILASGMFSDHADFGGSIGVVRTSRELHQDGFLARYDLDGTLLSMRPFVGTHSAAGHGTRRELRELEPLPDGSLAIAGQFIGAIELDRLLEALTCCTENDLFGVRLGPTGELSGSWALRGGREQHVVALDADPEGRLYLAGNSREPLESAPFEGSEEAGDFFGRMRDDGSWYWGVAVAQRAMSDLLATPEGLFVVTASFGDAIDLGCGPRGADVPHLHLARFDVDGECISHRAYVGAAGQAPRGMLARAPDGEIYVVGFFHRSLDFGDARLEDDVGGIFLARFAE